MKTKLITMVLTSSMALTACNQNQPATNSSPATSSSPAHLSADELNRRNIERRAIEAATWGMSAVNTDLMRQEMFRKTTGKENGVLYWSRPADANNQTLTPNPDCIYFLVFYNTKDVGPVVIE